MYGILHDLGKYLFKQLFALKNLLFCLETMVMFLVLTMDLVNPTLKTVDAGGRSK